MKKYNNRNNIPIVSDKSSSWFDEFVSNLEKMEKEAVHSKEKDVSTFSRIDEIINGKKPKFSSVEEAVLSYQKATGLYDLLQARASTEQLAKANPIEFFHKHPEVKIFIDNYVEQNPVSASIPEAVIYQLMKDDYIRKSLGNIQDLPVEVKEYIKQKASEHALPQENSHNIGKVDLTESDTDRTENNPFAGCDTKGK